MASRGRASAMRQIRTAGGEEPKVHADLVRTADWLQVRAQLCLVGKDPGVFCVSLSISAA